MFEEEIKLEKESKSFSFTSPLLYIFLVIVLVMAGAAYWLFSQKRDLTPDQAKVVMQEILKSKGPSFVRFRVGTVKASIDEKPRDPHYKLLEKAGFVKLANAKDGAVQVTLTPLGEGTFSRIQGFDKSKNADGTESFMVPLATRDLVSIDKVVTTGPNSARVDFTWKWIPNKVGEIFDATSPQVQTFNTWDRATLIKSYGVDFYKQETKAAVNLVRTPKGWTMAVE
jgi:hypothetical protein